MPEENNEQPEQRIPVIYDTDHQTGLGGSFLNPKASEVSTDNLLGVPYGHVISGDPVMSDKIRIKYDFVGDVQQFTGCGSSDEYLRLVAEFNEDLKHTDPDLYKKTMDEISSLLSEQNPTPESTPKLDQTDKP